MGLINQIVSGPSTTTTSPDTAADSFLSLANLNAPGAVDRYDLYFNHRIFLKPFGVNQIGAFAFDYEGEDTVTLDNEATDHWLEDNTAVQDHIGVKPITVTLRGQVSELALSNSIVSVINAAFATVQNALSQAPAYLGKYTPGVTDTITNAISQAENVAIQIEQAIARARQLASFFTGKPSLTKQQTAYNQLASLRDARILFTVYTPFQVFYNMTIINLRFSQPDRTKYSSDITVTMKQLQFASTLSAASYAAIYGGNLVFNGQAASISGNSAGSPTAQTPSEAWV